MSSMSWETADFTASERAARPATRRPAARLLAERPVPERLPAGNRAGRVAAIGLAALFGVTALALLAAVLLRGGPAPDEIAPQTAATAEKPPAAEPPAAEQPAAEPVAAVTAPPPAAIEQPALPAGSVRFAGSEAPAAAAPDRPAVDTARTASILSPAAGVAVAETEQQAVEMESRLAAAGARDFKVPDFAVPAPDNDPAAVPVTVAAAAAAPAEPFPPVSELTPGRAAKWVNLRAAPDNDAAVLAVVPYDAAILTQPDCPHWCAVVYDGRQGYIYKSFVVHPGQPTAGG